MKPTNYAPRMYVPIHWGYASEQERFENEGYDTYERTEDIEWEDVIGEEDEGDE